MEEWKEELKKEWQSFYNEFKNHFFDEEFDSRIRVFSEAKSGRCVEISHKYKNDSLVKCICDKNEFIVNNPKYYDYINQRIKDRSLSGYTVKQI